MNKATTIRSYSGTTIVVLLLASLLTGCATIKTGSHQDESVSFDNYRSFTWISDDPLILGAAEPPPISPLTKKKIVQAIEGELRKKGFTYLTNSDQADFIVSYTVGTREKIDSTSYPTAYRGEWGWHIYGRHYYLTEVEHRSYTEGTLGVDIFDGKTKQPVWHGWAAKTISATDRQDPSPSIQKAAARIIARFPANN